MQRSRVEGAAEIREVYERLRGSVRRAVVGKDRVVDLCLISLFAGGHVLLTDIPGVGKTTLARAISSSISAEFSRIQFTPDLLPSDITRTSIYDPREARFNWLPGPVFAPVLLADEINRATPRTQSALLEAMAGGQVTVEGETRTLPTRSSSWRPRTRTSSGRRYLAKRRRKPDPQRSIKVSDARIYSRYKTITSALKEASFVREEHETPEEYARRAAKELNEASVARLGEIYLYARFRNAVPAAMVEEFDRLEPEAFRAVERLKEASTVRS